MKVALIALLTGGKKEVKFLCHIYVFSVSLFTSRRRR